jgi:hypothetical protein
LLIVDSACVAMMMEIARQHNQALYCRDGKRMVRKEQKVRPIDLTRTVTSRVLSIDNDSMTLTNQTCMRVSSDALGRERQITLFFTMGILAW